MKKQAKCITRYYNDVERLYKKLIDLNKFKGIKKTNKVEKIYEKIEKKLNEMPNSSKWKYRFQRSINQEILNTYFNDNFEDFERDIFEKEIFKNKETFINKQCNQLFFEIAKNQFLSFHEFIDKTEQDNP